MWNRFMKRFVVWLDPKLDRFRAKKEAPKFTPKSLAEFVDVLRRTPKNVLSDADRNKISAVMSFDARKVKDIMVKKSDMVFVYEKDFLGPLTLDRLYKSGFIHFPVVDSKDHVKGVIHTDALNTLEIKKTDRAEKYLDKNFQYLHAGDSLVDAVDKIKKTGCFFFLVLNEKDELAGSFTLEMLLDYLIG